MITLENVGSGVQIFGNSSPNWVRPEGRRLYDLPVVFDTKSTEPWYDEKTRHIMLPAQRRQPRYAVHLLETGEALVFKGKKRFLYTLTPNGLAVLKLIAQP